MQLPRALARTNRWVTNPIQKLWAGRLPMMAIVEHEGRKSRRRYRTPVNAFPTEQGFAVLLFYGEGTDWVKNVMAAGEAHLVQRGRRVRVTEPRVVDRAEAGESLPRPAREVGRGLNIERVLVLRRAVS